MIRPLFPAFTTLLAVLTVFGASLQAQTETTPKKVPPAIKKKLDAFIEELESEDEVHHIFVRMKGQFLPTAAAYDAFCAKNRSAKRRELRKTVIAELKSRSDASWKKIEKLVRKMGGTLETDGDEEEEEEEVEEEDEEGVEDLVDECRRYWIVNGFACTANYSACLKLAAHPEVEFIYKNQSPYRLPAAHNQPHSVMAKRSGGAYARLAGNREEAIERFLEMYEKTRDAEARPFSSKGLEIPWNLKQTGADKVWDQEKLTGKGIIVAVSDLGCLPSPALVQALWRNPKETYDEKDEDGNGYVDDIFGYDFMFQNGVSIGELLPETTHGSHCGGIVAGRPFKVNEKRTIVTGVAPRAKLMVLRALGQLPSFEYLLENGADVVSMSFGYVNVEIGNWRGLYRSAFQHLSAAGVVMVGAAGNSGPGKKTRRASQDSTPTGKQICLPTDIPQVIVVGGVEKDNTVSPASSRGPVYWDDVLFFNDYPKSKPLQKPDLVSYFGGFPCWMYVTQGMARTRKDFEIIYQFEDATGLVSGPQGTSYSGPHAAGVAALMLEANPDLPAWRIKEIMIETTKDLGKKGWDPDFGHGLLQALPAVRAAKKAK